MAVGIDPKVDYAFKRVFGDERNADILMHLLNAVLKPREPIVRLEVLNPFNEKDFHDDKLSVLDIKARDQTGRLVNVEMQLLLPQHLRSRILYYSASLYRQQLGEGAPYDQLRPATSICFLNRALFPQVEDYHLIFGLQDERYGCSFTDQMHIHLLELPKFRRQLGELRDPLEKWLYFFLHAATMDVDNLPLPLRERAFERAIRELEMLARNLAEYARYESREKGIRDQISILEEAAQAFEKAADAARAELRSLERGLEQGLERGMQQGLERGQLIGKIHLCERSLKRQLTPAEVLVSLPLEELHRRCQDLQTEVFGESQ